MKKIAVVTMMLCVLVGSLMPGVAVHAQSGVDTGQTYCYDEHGNPMVCPAPEERLFGQDANYVKTQPAFQDNGDGTITDLNTGLMWQQTPGEKVSWADAMANAATLNLAGYNDWRVPTITELYSLMNFNGVTGTDASNATPYIDTNYFDFEYGDTSAGYRHIDAQYWSSTLYTSTTMQGNETAFGVNFADGRIKGYGTIARNQNDLRFVRYVRGTTDYGTHEFVDNGNGTITDNVSGLMWMQYDSGAFPAGSSGNGTLNWGEALDFCENLSHAGYDNWRLPDAKELQALVDYSRSPDATNSAAIDPIFNVTQILDSEGQPNYAYYWTSTTHLDGPDFAVYVTFGEAHGYMQTPPDSGTYTLMDVHGAGAQRSDPKTGNPADHPVGNGPQGDVIRIYNYARCVRGGEYEIFSGGSTAGAPTTVAAPGGAGAIGQPGGQQGGQQQGGQTPQGGQGQAGQPGGAPPPEAVSACTGLTEGAVCSFTAPNGTVNGTCAMIQSQLACRP